MDSASILRPTSTFVILNPKSGTSSVDAVRRSIAPQLESGEFVLHQLEEGDDLRRLVADAIDRGAKLVLAAGGDGTVSTVADVLAGTSVTLAIIPMGTTNVLARELGIPTETGNSAMLPAVGLALGEHSVVRIDAMKIKGRHYFTQVGIGIDALMIRDTNDDAKRRFGRAAYLWTAFTRLLGFQARRFTITVDNRTLVVRASQVVVANVGMLGQPPYRWGPDIRPDDGRVTVCVIKAKSILHFGNLLWHVVRGRHRQSSHIRYFVSERSISIASKHKVPVQADGEIVGDTPIHVDVVPATLRVVVPATYDGPPDSNS